jgi:hypothetical protein
MSRHAKPALVVLAGIVVYAAFGFRLANSSPKTDSPDSIFRKEILQAARDYKSWGRVDDEMRWAPELCRMPQPGRPWFSASKDEDTHGQKLYSLFIKKRDAYFSLGKTKTAPVGQVIVKESWIPEETSEVKPGRFDPDFKKIERTGDPITGDHFYPYATKGGKVYKAAKSAGLFVMMKLDSKTQDTDDGWVYGTASADGKSVTAAGKVESCMRCHVDAKYDRQFGLAAK